MALVAITLTVRDGKTPPNESTVTLYTTDGYTLPQLVAAVIVVAPLIKNLITGGISSATLAVDVDLSGIVGIEVADPDSDTEEGALFIWDTDGGHDKRNRIPTFDEALLVSGTREVDTADLNVIAFNNAMIAGVTVAGPATVEFVDSRGEELNSLQDAYESFQGSRKRK